MPVHTSEEVSPANHAPQGISEGTFTKLIVKFSGAMLRESSASTNFGMIRIAPPVYSVSSPRHEYLLSFLINVSHEWNLLCSFSVNVLINTDGIGLQHPSFVMGPGTQPLQ